MAWSTRRRRRRGAARTLYEEMDSDVDKSRETSGAMAQQKRTTPRAAIKFTRAFLGSVNHQARTAETIKTVGISVVDAVHDISVRCGATGGRKRRSTVVGSCGKEIERCVGGEPKDDLGRGGRG